MAAGIQTASSDCNSRRFVAGRFSRNAHLQSAHRRIHYQAWTIFSNLILADEINRAPAKVQSALLEAMQERQVTIGTKLIRFPIRFWFLATQNQSNRKARIQLPEANSIVSMFKLNVG